MDVRASSPASPASSRELVRELAPATATSTSTATINESLRRRPVLPIAEPRLTKQPFAIGGWDVPGGRRRWPPTPTWSTTTRRSTPTRTRSGPSASSTSRPGTYTWIPFGGGRRRCIGASFALLEMKTVLRAVLERSDLRVGQEGVEVARRRSITVSPKGGARVVLADRPDAVAGPPAPEVAAV